MVKPLFNRWIFVFFARLLNNSFLLFLCCIFQMFRKSSPGYDTPASQSSRGSNHGESIFTGYDTPASHIPGVAYTGESISPGGMIPKRVHFPGNVTLGSHSWPRGVNAHFLTMWIHILLIKSLHVAYFTPWGVIFWEL